MSLSPFDHPFLSGLLGDDEVLALLSPQADIAAMILFESALAGAEGAAGIIPDSAAGVIVRTLESVGVDNVSLREGAARDGVVVPALLKQLRAAIGGEAAGYLHFGASSRDVVDTSLSLRLKQVLDLFGIRLYKLAELLREIEIRDGAIEIMAHTAAEGALPVPAARRIRIWREPLERHRAHLQTVSEHVAVLHFGGAGGTLDQLGECAWDVTNRLAQKLELRVVERSFNGVRDTQAELAGWLSIVTGSLGRMGQDIALMAQLAPREIVVTTEDGAPQKPGASDPVGAGTLVALARFNAALVSAMHHSLAHENERSGAAWIVEWMVLPQMVMATAAAMRTADALLRTVSFVEKE